MEESYRKAFFDTRFPKRFSNIAAIIGSQKISSFKIKRESGALKSVFENSGTVPATVVLGSLRTQVLAPHATVLIKSMDGKAAKTRKVRRPANYIKNDKAFGS